MTTNRTGFTPDFEAYVVSKAAELVRAGWLAREAIVEAMRWTVALYAELAQGETARAKAFRQEAAERVYAAVRKEAA